MSVKEKIMKNPLVQYVLESKEELKKVVWPDRKTVINHSIIVSAISVFVTAYIYGLDQLFNYLVEYLISLS